MLSLSQFTFYEIETNKRALLIRSNIFFCRKCAMNVIYIKQVDVITFVSLLTFFKSHPACILFWSNISGFQVS